MKYFPLFINFQDSTCVLEYTINNSNITQLPITHFMPRFTVQRFLYGVTDPKHPYFNPVKHIFLSKPPPLLFHIRNMLSALLAYTYKHRLKISNQSHSTTPRKKQSDLFPHWPKTERMNTNRLFFNAADQLSVVRRSRFPRTTLRLNRFFKVQR